MIFVTGDCHMDFSRFNMENFPIQKELTKDDYVVICGDFGGIWWPEGPLLEEHQEEEEWWLNWLDKKSFTTLFVDGNHENFDRLNAFPIEEWRGGKVHKIRPSVIHLIRGEVFDLCGRRCLALGGASSHDIKDGILEVGDPRIEKWKNDYFKLFRINHVSWWKEEKPDAAEMERIKENLSSVKHVDYIFSHEAPASILYLYGGGWYKPDDYSKFLEEIRCSINYRFWFFGHYHEDKSINSAEHMMYEKFYVLYDEGEIND